MTYRRKPRTKADFLKRITAAGFVIAGALFCVNQFNQASSAALSVLAAGQEASSKPQGPPVNRFDNLVREDYFAGLAGDEAALDRAIKTCEETLARNPKHAEAMVWHGAGLLLRASFAFQKADMRKGAELWDRGMNEMDEGVSIAPNNVGTRISRGATLLGAAAYAFDKKQAHQMLQTGVADYEFVLELQKPYFNKLSAHSRGELLFGLASGWHQLGDNEKARQYAQRVVSETQGSGREKQAAALLEKGALPAQNGRMTCTGCHSKSK